MSCPIPVHDDVKHAMDKLQSLHDGDIAVVLDAISCGARAIPPLRTLLFVREPSGLFEVRCRAVEVPARLDAYDVLGDFLTSHIEAADPVERMETTP